jgi:hypothetical protein
MTTRIARIFATPQTASAAAEALKAQGFPESSVTVIAAGGHAAGSNSADVDAITARIMAAYILKAHAKLYADCISRGAALVVVAAPWGTAVTAQEIMAQFAPVDAGVAEPHDPPRVWDEKRPFSSAFGLKLLGGSASPVSDALNVPLLSHVKAPLSEALHVGTLTNSAASLSGVLGLPMVSKAGRSLSEAVGLPAVSSGGRSLSEVIGLPTQADGIGIPSVVHNARSTSEAIGLPTVSKRGRALSEALGIPTLTKGKRSVTEGIGIPTLMRRRSASV